MHRAVEEQISIEDWVPPHRIIRVHTFTYTLINLTDGIFPSIYFPFDLIKLVCLCLIAAFARANVKTKKAEKQTK